MKTRILLTLMLLLMGTLALAQKSVPTCNGFDPTGAIPMYFAPANATGAAETVAALAARLLQRGLLAPSTSGSGRWPRVFGLPACP